MKICFYGVGGVGGYFGAIMTKELNTNHEFYFIARGKHKDAICKNGLTLKKSGGKEIVNVSPKLCVDNVEKLPVFDIVVLSVKSYDLSNVANDLNKISSENTIVLPLLNGVDIYERIREHLSFGIILPSCVYVGTHIESPGVIYQKGGSCQIHIGKDPKFPNIYPEKLLQLLKDSHVDYTWEEDIRVAIWSKFIFIAAYGMVGAAYEKTLGEILEDSKLALLVKSIMIEIENIAMKLNINLDKNIVESSFLKAQQFPYETKTSFQRDFELKGNKNESDLFGGTIIRYGKSLNILTPNIIDVSEILKKRLG